MDSLKVAGGALLLLASSAVLFAAGSFDVSIATAAGLALASLGLAAGSLLVGTSESDGRPV